MVQWGCIEVVGIRIKSSQSQCRWGAIISLVCWLQSRSKKEVLEGSWCTNQACAVGEAQTVDLPRRWPVLPEIWRTSIQHGGMQQWAGDACTDQESHLRNQQKHDICGWQRSANHLQWVEGSPTLWTITTVSRRWKELQLGELTPDCRHRRRPHCRKLVKHPHTCRRRRRQQGQHMEDVGHQWISMQHALQQSVSDAARSVTLNATAPMHLNPGKKQWGDSTITETCIQQKRRQRSQT